MIADDVFGEVAADVWDAGSLVLGDVEVTGAELEDTICFEVVFGVVVVWDVAVDAFREATAVSDDLADDSSVIFGDVVSGAWETDQVCCLTMFKENKKKHGSK